ncbi:MAG: hypothetical protein K0S34_806 [Bacillales bacterium]|jgi:redox-sensitive bicupin YhaK (pirin superfamily)|nr:hypothetical protein [Bacillales bacterium]
MLKINRHQNMGSSNLGWLRSLFHFSFAEYFNRYNMNFGVLRVLNDDLIYPNTGFDTHPHKDMEIISYVVDGRLTHGDSMGNENTIERGHVQYMSAGSGVFHSEHNYTDKVSRFLQIWIMPDKKGHFPTYGDMRFDWDERVNKLLHMVSPKEGNAPIKINQDVNIFSLFLEDKKIINFKVSENRQAYIVQIEGNSNINDVELFERDSLETIGEDLKIISESDSHYLIIEMSK